MSPATLLRLAIAGTRIDRMRVALTALGVALTTFDVLAAAAVWWMPWPGPVREHNWYRLQTPGWRYATLLLNAHRRPWVCGALLVLTIPALVLAAQSARLGGPARDRRLAAIRLAGGTPGQARLLVALETAMAGVVGTALGFGGYLLGLRLADQWVLANPDAEETSLGPEYPGHLHRLLELPTDTRPPWWLFAAVAVAGSALAAVLSLVALRRVTVSPLGVARRVPRYRPPWWPLSVLAAGVAAVWGHLAVDRYRIADPDIALPSTAWIAALLLAGGVAWSSAPLGQLVAAITYRLARRPAPLVAARRVLADPWSGSRGTAVILVATGIGAAALTWLSILRTQSEAARLSIRLPVGSRAFSESVIDLATEPATKILGLAALVVSLLIAGSGLLCALVEGTVARRRTLVTLVAAGTSRATLAGVSAWQALLPAVPGIGLALAVGTIAPRLATHDVRTIDGRVLPVPVPWLELAVLGGAALTVVLLAVALSVPVLRTSTDLAELRTE